MRLSPTHRFCVFLAGKGPLTRRRENKYGALAGFYRYAVSRGFASRSPLPDNEPKPPPSAPPYIYSHDELRRLIGAIEVSQSRALQLDADTFRTLLLLLYGNRVAARRSDAPHTGRRRSVRSGADRAWYEVLQEPSSFPVGSQTRPCAGNICGATCMPCLHGGKGFILFSRNRDGTPLAANTVQEAFGRLRRTTGNPWHRQRRPYPAPAFVQAYVSPYIG